MPEPAPGSLPPAPASAPEPQPPSEPLPPAPPPGSGVVEPPVPAPRPRRRDRGPFPATMFPSWIPWRPPRVPVERTQGLWLKILVPFLIFVLAFGFYQQFPIPADHPPIIVFDEAHYVKVARNYTRGVFIDPAWSDPRPQNFEHPPVGKYLIAAGIWLNGMPHDDMENQAYITKLCGHDNEECRQDAWGWRFGSTVVGASGIVAAYFLGLRFFNRFSAGILTASLLALDGLYYMHARLAMLDIFPTVFLLWAFAFVFSPRKSGRWWSSVFYGLAVASKFYALYLLPVFVLCHFIRSRPPIFAEPPASEASALSTVGGRIKESIAPYLPWLKRLGPTVAFSMALPVLVHMAAYAPYWYLWTQMGGPIFAIREFVFVQISAFTWDFAADATHPYSSPPSTWLVIAKPVYYYTFDYADGDVGKMWSIGNPFVWWTAALAMFVVPIKILWRFLRDYGWHYLRADFVERLIYFPFWLRRDLMFVVTGLLFLSGYLPWFLIQRITFLFYMTFLVPAFALFAGGLLGEQWDRGGIHRLLTILYVVLAAGVFLIFFPVVSGIKVDVAHYKWVMHLLPLLDVKV
jgi:dolichyl-phosphate-mannose-protein mannosyltransferase